MELAIFGLLSYIFSIIFIHMFIKAIIEKEYLLATTCIVTGVFNLAGLITCFVMSF